MTSSGRFRRRSPVAADQVTAGGAHSCAVGRAVLPGGVDDFVCWGSDQAGQLGDNGDEDRSLPTPIKPSQLPASVSAGALHTCAIDQSALLWCWGRGIERPARTRPPGRHALPDRGRAAERRFPGDRRRQRRRPHLRAGQPGRRTRRRDLLLRRQQLRSARRRHDDLAADAGAGLARTDRRARDGRRPPAAGTAARST